MGDNSAESIPINVDENGGIICDIDETFSNRHNNEHEHALIT
jgi:hypothetical protein